MARLIRVEYEGALYHVTLRGVERRALFRGDDDRQRMIDKLAEGTERFALDVYAYCLMANHVHLLVGTPRGNLSRFMGWWLTAYVTYFNRRHERHGHLTQGRYGAKLAEGDRYLLTLSRYIHLNPVETRSMKERPMTERLEALRAYRWSSYPGYASARFEAAFVRYAPLLALVGQGQKHTRRAYRTFVEQGLAEAEPEWNRLQSASRIAIGSEDFIDQMERRYEQLAHQRTHPEDVALRRLGHRTDPAAVLEVTARAFGLSVEEVKRRRRGVWDRAVAAHGLVRYSGLTQREAAGWLGLNTGVAVGALLRKLQSALPRDPHLQEVMRSIDAGLRAQST